MYSPEAETDFTFSIIGEELGCLVGALFVIALFVAVLVCGLLIAKRASDDFGTMIAGGLTCMLVGQAFLNMACATGLFPTTGKPLPFISSGGSSGRGVAFDGGYHHVGFACGGRRSADAASRERRATSSEPERYSRGRRTASAFALFFV